MKVYIIGAGFIGRTHAAASEKLSDPVQLRVADLNANVLEGFREQYPDAVTFTDIQEMLDSEEAHEDDIVIVATPPFAHLEPTRLALASGRHVLCEKPLAMNVQEAEEMMTQLAESHGKYLGCCSVRFKGMPHMEKVKEIISSGKLGDIYHMTFVNKMARSRAGIEYQPTSPWFLDSKKSGGGILMDWGPYDFATLNDILDPDRIDFNTAWTAKPITDIDPTDKTFDVETHVGALLTFNGSHQVQVHYERASCAHGEEYGKAEIEGTKGALKWAPFDSKQPVFLRYDKDGQVVEEQVDTGARSELTIFDNPLLHFSRKVKGQQSHANVNEQVLNHFRCLRTFYEVAESGQKQSINMK